jgi:hypothetical protein
VLWNGENTGRIKKQLKKAPDPGNRDTVEV